MMKNSIVLYSFLVINFLIASCSIKQDERNVAAINWGSRTIELSDSLTEGRSYLPVFRQLYLQEDKLNHPLNITISIRNPSKSDSIFLNKIYYLNKEGQLIRSYLNKTVFLKPLETIDFGVSDNSPKLGTGASFVFNWSVRNPINQPHIEAVKIMTAGQQGISFTSKAIITN